MPGPRRPKKNSIQDHRKLGEGFIIFISEKSGVWSPDSGSFHKGGGEGIKVWNKYYFVKQLLCYSQVTEMIFHSGGVVLQKGVSVTQRVAGLKYREMNSKLPDNSHHF